MIKQRERELDGENPWYEVSFSMPKQLDRERILMVDGYDFGHYVNRYRDQLGEKEEAEYQKQLEKYRLRQKKVYVVGPIDKKHGGYRYTIDSMLELLKRENRKFPQYDGYINIHLLLRQLRIVGKECRRYRDIPTDFFPNLKALFTYDKKKNILYIHYAAHYWSNHAASLLPELAPNQQVAIDEDGASVYADNKLVYNEVHGSKPWYSDDSDDSESEEYCCLYDTNGEIIYDSDKQSEPSEYILAQLQIYWDMIARHHYEKRVNNIYSALDEHYTRIHEYIKDQQLDVQVKIYTSVISAKCFHRETDDSGVKIPKNFYE